MFTRAKGDESMAVNEEVRSLHVYVLLLAYVQYKIVSVFSLTMFTATTVLCNSITVCLKLETSETSYPGILKLLTEMSNNFVCSIC